MGIMRSLLLAGSQSTWLRTKAMRYKFVRRSVSRFMPGETADEALAAARTLQGQGVTTIITHLGENVTDAKEAETVTQHYLEVLQKITGTPGHGTRVSVSIRRNNPLATPRPRTDGFEYMRLTSP